MPPLTDVPVEPTPPEAREWLVEELAKPEYQGLTVLIDPLSSSTGASFLASTVAAFGEEGYNAYWQSLVDNDARVAQG